MIQSALMDLERRIVHMKQILHYSPRILSILFCLFIMMFSFDVFEGDNSIFEMLIGFFMHNLPVFGMAIITFFAWNNDLIGGVGFIGVSLFFFFLVSSNMNNEGGIMNPAVFIISLPALLISALYFINFRYNHKKE